MTQKDKHKLFEALAALDALQDEYSPSLPADCVIDGYKLVCTCPACPEQYDVFDKDEKPVGYLRLRHGYFRADYPDCGAETIYVASPKGDGIFDDDERQHYLTEAVAAIDARIKRDQTNDHT